MQKIITPHERRCIGNVGKKNSVKTTQIIKNSTAHFTGILGIFLDFGMFCKFFWIFGIFCKFFLDFLNVRKFFWIFFKYAISHYKNIRAKIAC